TSPRRRRVSTRRRNSPATSCAASPGTRRSSSLPPTVVPRGAAPASVRAGRSASPSSPWSGSARAGDAGGGRSAGRLGGHVQDRLAGDAPVQQGSRGLGEVLPGSAPAGLRGQPPGGREPQQGGQVGADVAGVADGRHRLGRADEEQLVRREPRG